MIDRREALAALGMATLSGAGQKIVGFVDLFQTKAVSIESTQKESEPMNHVEEQLVADLKRTATKVYSEEGIPMILACEDLAESQKAALPPTASNAVLSSAFARYTQAWHRMHPDATAADATKLIELLADKDFASGGKDTNL